MIEIQVKSKLKSIFCVCIFENINIWGLFSRSKDDMIVILYSSEVYKQIQLFFTNKKSHLPAAHYNDNIDRYASIKSSRCILALAGLVDGSPKCDSLLICGFKPQCSRNNFVAFPPVVTIPRMEVCDTIAVKSL